MVIENNQGKIYAYMVEFQKIRNVKILTSKITSKNLIFTTTGGKFKTPLDEIYRHYAIGESI